MPESYSGKGKKVFLVVVIYWLVIIDLFHYFVGFEEDGDDLSWF